MVSTARAEDPVVYTRLAQWQIARPNWGAYEADLKKTQVPVMEKLLADGVITEFGYDRNSVHSPDGYTHSSWFCAGSQANLEKALDTIVAADDKLTPEQRRRQDTEFSGTKHADQILRSVLPWTRSMPHSKRPGRSARRKRAAPSTCPSPSSATRPRTGTPCRASSTTARSRAVARER